MTMTNTGDRLTQAEAATLAGVDRTTIRAWTQAGMPYAPPATRGEAAGYSPAVLVHWRFWTELKRSLTDLDPTPAQALALGHAMAAGFELDIGNQRSFEERVVSILRPFYSEAEALAAAGYARGVFAGRWSARRAA